MKITAYSTALYSTWINIEELNLLFDAGDGLTAGLLSKARKIKHVFVTHPDRDHINGLFQFNQLNARSEYPKIYYPQDSGSFPAIRDFQKLFDPHTQSSDWHGIRHNDEISIQKNVHVQAIRNEHIKAPEGIAKSLSFKIFESKRKLKQEFTGLDSTEIQKLVKEKGRETLTQEIRTNILSYSGDTPVDDYSKWDGSKILIHESTFLKTEGDSQVESRGNKHSRIDEVIEMAANIELEKLILNHFSSRYSKEEIDQIAKKMCKEYNIKIPVYLIYPGQIHRDILTSEPIN